MELSDLGLSPNEGVPVDGVRSRGLGGSFGCTPVPVCIDGDQRCSGSVLEDCVGGQWSDSADCAAADMACVESGDLADCVAPPAVEECTTDDDCAAPTRCLQLNTSWRTVSVCAEPCTVPFAACGSADSVVGGPS